MRTIGYRPILLWTLFLVFGGTHSTGLANSASGSESLQDSAEALQLAEKVAGRILTRESFPVEYTIELQLQALLALGDATGDEQYLKFVQEIIRQRQMAGYQYSWRDDFFSSLSFDVLVRSRNKDDIKPFLVETYKYRDESFRAFDRIVSYYPGHAQVRVPEERPVFTSSSGATYLRKSWQPILVDQVQEYASRLAKAGSLNGDKTLYMEAVDQIELLRKALRDPKTGLWAHGRGWSGSATVVTSTKWGRAQAWILRGLVETLTYLPPGSPEADRVAAILKEFASALVSNQTEAGFWRQVVDRPDSYEETSATGLISYYLARAVRQGLLPESPYRSASIRAFEVVGRMKVSAQGDVYDGSKGTPPLPSSEDYVRREAPPNDGHAVAAVVFCSAGRLLLDGKGSIPDREGRDHN